MEISVPWNECVCVFLFFSFLFLSVLSELFKNRQSRVMQMNPIRPFEQKCADPNMWLSKRYGIEWDLVVQKNIFLLPASIQGTMISVCFFLFFTLFTVAVCHPALCSFLLFYLLECTFTNIQNAHIHNDVINHLSHAMSISTRNQSQMKRKKACILVNGKRISIRFRTWEMTVIGATWLYLIRENDRCCRYHFWLLTIASLHFPQLVFVVCKWVYTTSSCYCYFSWYFLRIYQHV